MARTRKRKGSILLVKGIDVSSPAEFIDDHSLVNSINFLMDRKLIEKRFGTSQLGATVGGTNLEIMGGKEFIREGSRYNVRVSREKIEKYNNSTEVWDDITGSDLTGGSTDLVSFAVPLLSGKRILCIANGVDNIRKWTGTGNTADLGGTPPVAKFIQEYKTYLVTANVAGGTDISQRMQWSDTADPENWTSGNSGAVDLVEDGDDITGLSIYGDYVAVHKPKAIYLGQLVSTTNIFQFNRKNTGVGTIANGSIVNIPTGEQVFLADDGIRVFNGISAPLIESPINDEIRDTLNKSVKQKAWGVLVAERDEAWIGIPIGDFETGDTIYKFNYLNRTIHKDYRQYASAGWLGEASSSLAWDDYTAGVSWDSVVGRWNASGLVSASDQINVSFTNGTTQIVDGTERDDAGVAVSAVIETKDFIDASTNLARWQRMELWAKGSSVKVEYSTDEGSTWTEASDSPFTLTDEFPTDISPIIVYFDVLSSRIRFRFSNANSNESLSIKQFIVFYVPREMRR